jgi:cyclohexanecarboxylate-CoA ligase
MQFDIYLPPERIARSRGLWAERLPIDELDAATNSAPEQTAFVGWNSALQREIRLTYAELSDRVDRIAIGLVALGIGKGDVVAVQLANWGEFTALFFACNRIGAVANPLMPIFRQRELRFMLSFSEAKIAIVPARWRGFDHLAMIRRSAVIFPTCDMCLRLAGPATRTLQQPFFTGLSLPPTRGKVSRRFGRDQMTLPS